MVGIGTSMPCLHSRHHPTSGPASRFTCELCPSMPSPGQPEPVQCLHRDSNHGEFLQPRPVRCRPAFRRAIHRGPGSRQTLIILSLRNGQTRPPIRITCFLHVGLSVDSQLDLSCPVIKDQGDAGMLMDLGNLERTSFTPSSDADKRIASNASYATLQKSRRHDVVVGDESCHLFNKDSNC